MLVHLHNIWNSELTMRIIFCSPTKMCTHVQLKHKINNCAVGYKTNICKFTYDLKTLYRFILFSIFCLFVSYNILKQHERLSLLMFKLTLARKVQKSHALYKPSVSMKCHASWLKANYTHNQCTDVLDDNSWVFQIFIEI